MDSRSATGSRDKIIESAKRMFWLHGYSTTSPRQVMADSGIGQGSFYHHFPAKTDLGKEVVTANADDLLRAVRAATATQTSGFDKLAVFLRSADDALAGCRIGGFAYDSGVMAEPVLREALGVAFAELIALLEDTVRTGQQDGSLPPGLDPASTAAAAVALVEGLFVIARAAGSQAVADSAAEGAVGLLALLAAR